MGSKVHSHEIYPVVTCLRAIWYITTGDLLPGNMVWNVPNSVRIGPIFSIEVTVDLWPDVTSMKVALIPPWGWDGCMYQIGLVFIQRMEPNPLQKGLLFLDSFISSLCLLLVLSIGLIIYHSNLHKNNFCTIIIHKFKFAARLVIRRDFGYDLPLCIISKCGQFNLNPT